MESQKVTKIIKEEKHLHLKVLENTANFLNIFENTTEKMEEILVNLISDEGSEYKKNYYSSREQMTHLNMAKDLNTFFSQDM